MKGCLVGIIIGIAISVFCAYYFHCKKNPERPGQDIKTVEETWEKTKAAGDKIIESVKPYTTAPGSTENK